MYCVSTFLYHSHARFHGHDCMRSKTYGKKTGRPDARTPETGRSIRIATTRAVPHASLKHGSEHEAMFNGNVQSDYFHQSMWTNHLAYHTAQIAQAYLRIL